VVSLNSIEDADYAKFVTALIKKLFNVPVGIYLDKHDAVIDLAVSRVELVRFCVEKLGLKIGNKVKQQVDIPDWIKKDKQYLIACMRGLIDTDGSVFLHRYEVNGKWYTYPKVSFANYSLPLLRGVFDTLISLGIKPRMSKDRKDVRIESQKDVKLYFDLVGTSNVKDLKKYSKYDKVTMP
jgi:intein/homing endonuclease